MIKRFKKHAFNEKKNIFLDMLEHDFYKHGF